MKTLCKLAVIQYNLDQSCLPHDIRWELNAMTTNSNISCPIISSHGLKVALRSLQELLDTAEGKDQHKSDGVRIHLKRGLPDQMLYSTTMALTRGRRTCLKTLTNLLPPVKFCGELGTAEINGKSFLQGFLGFDSPHMEFARKSQLQFELCWRTISIKQLLQAYNIDAQPPTTAFKAPPKAAGQESQKPGFPDLFISWEMGVRREYSRAAADSTQVKPRRQRRK
ncbi:hypothetical protein GH733_017761 [Mirounga leonina]|nr:hypothetical protein GH733_017761 [Mirounga leonina]